MKKLMIGIGVVTLMLFVAFMNSDERREYSAWEARHDEWRRRCAPITETTSLAARTCVDEFRALSAMARRHGWKEIR